MCSGTTNWWSCRCVQMAFQESGQQHPWPQDVYRQDVALPLMVFLEFPWMEPGHLKGLSKGHLKSLESGLVMLALACTWCCCACFVRDRTKASKQAHSFIALRSSETTDWFSCCIRDQRFTKESSIHSSYEMHGFPWEMHWVVWRSLPRTPKEWCFARRWCQQASDEGFLEGVWSAEWDVCWGLQRTGTRHCYLAATRSPRQHDQFYLARQHKTAWDSLSKDIQSIFSSSNTFTWGFTHGNLAEIGLISILQSIAIHFGVKSRGQSC